MPVISSPASAEESVTYDPSEWWLKDPVDPARNMTIDVKGPKKLTRHAEQAKFNPLGRTDYLAVSDLWKDNEGTLQFDTIDEESYQAFVTLLESRRALLLEGIIWSKYIWFHNNYDESIVNIANPYREIGIQWFQTKAP